MGEVVSLDRAHSFLREAQDLLKQGDLEGAIGACENAIHVDPKFLAARELKSNALLEMGYLDEAISNLQRIVLMDSGNANARTLYEEAIATRKARNEQFLKRKSIEDYTVLKCLGIGWEGSVYLATKSGKKHIVKMFHPQTVRKIGDPGPFRMGRKPVERCRSVLNGLSAHLLRQGKLDTLYAFSLMEKDGSVQGLVYEYEPLMRIKRRYLSLSGVVDGIVGAFFRTQQYLLSALNFCLADTKLANFMITKSGRFRYIDYGVAFLPINDFRCMEDHSQTRPIIRLMYQIFRPGEQHVFNGRDFDVVLDPKHGLTTVPEKYAFAKKILSRIEAGDHDAFLNPEFYRSLADQQPVKIDRMPLSVIRLDHGLSTAWRSFRNQ